MLTGASRSKLPELYKYGLLTGNVFKKNFFLKETKHENKKHISKNKLSTHTILKENAS